jgi:hypothetical protein
MKRDFRDSDEIQIVSSIIDSLALLCHSRLEGGHGPASHSFDVLASEVSEWLLKISNANGSWKQR